MAFDLDTLYGAGVQVDETVAKGALDATPQREGGGWVKPLIQRFNEDQAPTLFLPVSQFPPAREGSAKTDGQRAKQFAQSIRTAARETLRVDVNARSLTVDAEMAEDTGIPEGTVGVLLTHEYPEKSNRGRRPTE